MSAGENFVIYVTHVEDGNLSGGTSLHFSAQKEKLALAYLESCLESLNDHFETSPAPANLNTLYGSHMLCVFIDNVWIRAKLVNPNPSSSEKFDVFCVDYGKVRPVDIEQIRTLPLCKSREVKFLEEFPPFASQFTLADFVLQKPMLESSLSFLQKNFVNQYWNTVLVDTDGDRQRVKLFSGSGNLVAHELIEKGIGLDPADVKPDPIPNETGALTVRPGKKSSPSLL